MAANGANEAGAIELAAREPVMAMGGFNGSDPATTLDQLKAYIADGKLRFVIVGGAVGPGGSSVGTTRDSWVAVTCKPVKVGSATVGSLYDCAKAVPGG